MPKGFFRRAAALGCALLLCGGRALAEEFYTINEVRQQAAAGWHETYEAYGRTIVADVEPEIPNVTQIPIEKLEFARMTPRVTEEETGLQFVIRPEENVFGFYTRDFIEQVPNKIEKTTGLFLGYPSEWERAYAEGSDLTLSGMTDVVRKALALMQLDESSWDLEHPYELTTFLFRHPKTKEIVAPGEYMVSFHQKVNGIPLLSHAGAAFYRKTRGNTTIRLHASVIDGTMYDLSARMLKSSGRAAEDVPLCSFSKVIETAEKEIQSGHIRKIYDLSLGYLFYEDPEYVGIKEQTDHFYAVPVWQLNCLYLNDPRTELPEYGLDETGDERNSLEYAALVIDAQTGEMQDFMSEAKDRAVYHGFLSWEEIRE